jgi:DNA-binding response OmpR family regulator
MGGRGDRDRSFEVVIVSDNPETLDGLQSYLRGAGVTARCARDLVECTTFATATTIAFVLFPDDFVPENVVALIADLTRARPKAMSLLVTSEPHRFESLTSRHGVLVMPRPVWGWTLLDAIRAHLDRCMSKDSKPGK